LTAESSRSGSPVNEKYILSPHNVFCMANEARRFHHAYLPVSIG
jgi:hypothetical protein